MDKQRILWLPTVITLLLLAGCGGKKTEVSEEGPTSAQQQATPIDPATVATITGKILFQGAKPKLHRIMMDQDPVCVQKQKGPVYAEDGQVNDNGTLPNVFVYVREGAEK